GRRVRHVEPAGLAARQRAQRLFVDVGGDDPGAFALEALRRGLADAIARRGDERGFPGKTTCHCSCSLSCEPEDRSTDFHGSNRRFSAWQKPFPCMKMNFLFELMTMFTYKSFMNKEIELVSCSVFTL